MYQRILLALLLVIPALQQDETLIVSGPGLSDSVSVFDTTDASDLPPQPSLTAISASLTVGTTVETAANCLSTQPQISLSPSVPPVSWNFLKDHSLGGSSQWIYPKGSFEILPKKLISTYTITIDTDCPQGGVTLIFSTTGVSFVYLNDKLLLSWGSPYSKVNKLFLQAPDLLCGCNILKIKVYNCYYASPNGLIYSLKKHTENCYNCNNLGVTYYNKKTCQCQCASTGDCKNSLMKWKQYPQCGCVCGNKQLCQLNQYFNNFTCGCQCLPKCCPKGFVQDEGTCQCRPIAVCLPFAPCAAGEKWDPILCKCLPICPRQFLCPSNQVFNNVTCKCECLAVGFCASPKVWNPDTCQCECNIICLAIYSIDLQKCRCVPLFVAQPIEPILTKEDTSSDILVQPGLNNLQSGSSISGCV